MFLQMPASGSTVLGNPIIPQQPIHSQPWPALTRPFQILRPTAPSIRPHRFLGLEQVGPPGIQIADCVLANSHRFLIFRSLSWGRMKALFVEDYKPLRNSVSKGIREMGWAVDVTPDGEEGRWLALNHPYDVIILNLMLPKVSGLEILRQLRTSGSATPVLILTAKDAVGDRMSGLDAGADDYLVKPFFIGELLSRLKALVRRSYKQEDPVLRIGDLEIETNAREVRRRGRVIELTAREYSLLEYLARRVG